MPACSPSVTANPLTPPDGCEDDCKDKSFALTSVQATVGDDGSCQFVFVVTETDGDSTTTHNGSANVSCPGTSTVTYYCDAAKKCPKFEVVLTCGSV